MLSTKENLTLLNDTQIDEWWIGCAIANSAREIELSCTCVIKKEKKLIATMNSTEVLSDSFTKTKLSHVIFCDKVTIKILPFRESNG